MWRLSNCIRSVWAIMQRDSISDIEIGHMAGSAGYWSKLIFRWEIRSKCVSVGVCVRCEQIYQHIVIKMYKIALRSCASSANHKVSVFLSLRSDPKLQLHCLFMFFICIFGSFFFSFSLSLFVPFIKIGNHIYFNRAFCPVLSLVKLDLGSPKSSAKNNMINKSTIFPH